MDTENEYARGKWLLISVVGFLISCFFCYTELVYLIRGRDIEADVTNVWEVKQTNRLGETTGTKLSIEYTFTEPDGTRRKGSDYENINWKAKPTVNVRYTPGAEGRSRFVGHVNWVGIVIFFISVTVMALFGYRIWKSYSVEYAPRKSKY